MPTPLMSSDILNKLELLGKLTCHAGECVSQCEALLRDLMSEVAAGPKVEQSFNNESKVDADDALLSLSNLTEMLGLNRQTVWALRKSGQFPTAIRISQRRLAFRRQDITDWIASGGISR